jgi:hypothetical protein
MVPMANITPRVSVLQSDTLALLVTLAIGLLGYAVQTNIASKSAKNERELDRANAQKEKQEKAADVSLDRVHTGAPRAGGSRVFSTPLFVPPEHLKHGGPYRAICDFWRVRGYCTIVCASTRAFQWALVRPLGIKIR